MLEKRLLKWKEKKENKVMNSFQNQQSSLYLFHVQGQWTYENDAYFMKVQKTEQFSNSLRDVG